MSTDVWPLSDPPETGVFVTRLLWNGDEPLLGVRRHDDGDLSFFGATQADIEDDDAVVDSMILVHLHHVVERFPEVINVLDELPVDRCAYRDSPDAPFEERD
ncbi:MAG: hypothetical protein JWO88_3656 [Frankiales bacterium]|nr:hypothetical protein [Frankiales bacterium]